MSQRHLTFIAVIAVLQVSLFLFCKPIPGPESQNQNLKVHIAFGFHINTRHSFRGDKNDESGFGQDIRVIRHILTTLDKYNRQGVDVKGVWDMDSLFSLERVLPEYAPDIIKNIQHRVENLGDEIILMSYNNALSSALTEKEFRASIQKAISNGKKSGMLDLFGKYSAIARPQEMMTTPGIFSLYKELGVTAVSLYHSSIPFDAFRSFIPALTEEEALNPLLYKNPETGEKMIIIPTYNTGDLMENQSLRLWAWNVRKKQLSGEINRDVLIFVNSDADDPYWAGFGLPWYQSWLPNSGGLDQLIREVSRLDYVQFTTLSEYLKEHAPEREIYFGQDTADGNFNGYSSWSEKASSHKFWTGITIDRRLHEATERACRIINCKDLSPDPRTLLDLAFETRLRFLCILLKFPAKIN